MDQIEARKSWNENSKKCLSVYEDSSVKKSLGSALEAISNFCAIPTDAPIKLSRTSQESITIAQKTDHVGYFDDLVWIRPGGKRIDSADPNFLVTYQTGQNRATLAIFPAGSEISVTGEFRLLYKIRNNTIHISTFIIEEENEDTIETFPLPEFSEESPAAQA